MFEGIEVDGLPRFTLTRGEVAVIEDEIKTEQGHGGLPRFVLTRGQVAVTEDKISAEPGHGQFVAREANNPVNRAFDVERRRRPAQGRALPAFRRAGCDLALGLHHRGCHASGTALRAGSVSRWSQSSAER